MAVFIVKQRALERARRAGQKINLISIAAAVFVFGYFLSFHRRAVILYGRRFMLKSDGMLQLMKRDGETPPRREKSQRICAFFILMRKVYKNPEKT